MAGLWEFPALLGQRWKSLHKEQCNSTILWQCCPLMSRIEKVSKILKGSKYGKNCKDFQTLSILDRFHAVLNQNTAHSFKCLYISGTVSKDTTFIVPLHTISSLMNVSLSYRSFRRWISSSLMSSVLISSSLPHISLLPNKLSCEFSSMPFHLKCLVRPCPSVNKSPSGRNISLTALKSALSWSCIDFLVKRSEHWYRKRPCISRIHR